jgi:hypothetical protein
MSIDRGSRSLCTICCSAPWLQSFAVLPMFLTLSGYVGIAHGFSPIASCLVLLHTLLARPARQRARRARCLYAHYCIRGRAPGYIIIVLVRDRPRAHGGAGRRRAYNCYV